MFKQISTFNSLQRLQSFSNQKFQILCTAALSVLFFAGLAHGQSTPYPQAGRTVKIVVPYPAGGGTDSMARLVATKLADSLGGSFIVENRVGASGNIGLAQVAKAPADGYTLIMMPNNLAINPPLFGKVDYDAVKDFAPILLVGSSPVSIAANAKAPFKTFEEMLDFARRNPGKISYASCGNGTPQHLAGELLVSMAKLDMVHIPYKGCSSAISDVVSGIVPVSFSTIANVGPHVQSGAMRDLAVTTRKRSNYVPNVPAISESAGLKDFNIDVWFGLLAPAGTPSEVIKKINAAVNAALQSDDVKQRLIKANFEPLGGTPEQFAEVLQRDIIRYTKIIQDAQIKPD
jgi:tripartite-type tricarboxylate transporter receptor subunit TctC